MAMPIVARSDWTVEMLDALPDDGQRYEIIDGELFVTPAPGDVHQLVLGELHARFHAYLRGTSVGKVMFSPADVRRGDRTRNRVQPDLFVVRLREGTRPAYPFELSDLLLTIEAASPSNPRYDYQTKRRLYLQNGVPEYWVVNPDARNVSRWLGKDDPGEVLSRAVSWRPAAMADPLVIDIPELFDEALG